MRWELTPLENITEPVYRARPRLQVMAQMQSPLVWWRAGRRRLVLPREALDGAAENQPQSSAADVLWEIQSPTK